MKGPVFLWVTDPWECLDHKMDTTLRLAEESLKLGYKNYWCSSRSIRWEKGRVRLDSFQLVLRTATSGPGQAVQLGKPGPKSPDAFTTVQYRTDPPVDHAYLHPLQLLVLGNAKITNPPEVLFMSNEKVGTTFLMPPSVVASVWETLHAFGKAEGQTVLKPLFQAQSKGVELLKWNSREEIDLARRRLSATTDGFKRPVLLQRYLPGVSAGEQRLWFLDGKLLAHARKLPVPGDFRVDIDSGSKLVASVLSRREKTAALQIGKHLKRRKIRLAAVDLIDGYITDFNFTSPGLIRQMEAVTGKNLAGPIVRALVAGCYIFRPI